MAEEKDAEQRIADAIAGKQAGAKPPTPPTHTPEAEEKLYGQYAGGFPTIDEINKENEAAAASLGQGLGNPSTPGAGKASGPQPLRRFPGVMQGDQQGSPFVRRPINATPPSSGSSPPTRPAVQLVPTPPSGSPKPVINLPKGAGQVPATATMFLFLGLAAVALWNNSLRPLWDRAVTGKQTPLTMPSSAMVSLLLFGVLLIFVSELGPTAASFTALLMLGLWAVFLVMNPDVVKTFASWVSQGNTQAATAKQSQSKQASNKGA